MEPIEKNRKIETKKKSRVYKVGCVGSEIISPPCKGKIIARINTRYTERLTRNIEKPSGKRPPSAQRWGSQISNTERRR